MLNLKINDNYSLISKDPLNVTLLYTHYNEKKEKNVTTSLGYYPNIEFALKGYLKHASMNSDAEITSVNRLLEKLEEIKNTIENLNVGEL